jgi:hypothetical protein
LLLDLQDEDEAADLLRWAWSHPALMRDMGRAAQQKALQEFSPEKNYARLMEIYSNALAGNERRGIALHVRWRLSGARGLPPAGGKQSVAATEADSVQ